MYSSERWRIVTSSQWTEIIVGNFERCFLFMFAFVSFCTSVKKPAIAGRGTCRVLVDFFVPRVDKRKDSPMQDCDAALFFRENSEIH